MLGPMKTLHKPWRELIICDDKQNSQAIHPFFRVSELDKDPLGNDTKAEWKLMGCERLDKFTFQVITNFVSDCVERVANVVDISNMEGPPMIFLFARVWPAGNGDSLVSDGRCKHHTHLARLHTRNFFSCVWLKTQVFVLQHFCARHLGIMSTPFRMPCSAHLLIHHSRHLPILASTSSSLLFPSNWTSTGTPLFGADLMNNPFSSQVVNPNAPTEVSSEATPIVLHSRRCSLESTCDDLATTLDASEAGERSDLGWLASPLFPRERETSANPFGMYHSNTEGSEAPFFSLAYWHRAIDSEKSHQKKVHSGLRCCT